MEIETSDKETSNWMFEKLAGLRLESEGDPVGAPLFFGNGGARVARLFAFRVWLSTRKTGRP